MFYLLLFIPTLLRYSLNPSPAHLQGRTALDPAAQIYQLPAEAALWKISRLSFADNQPMLYCVGLRLDEAG